MTARIEEPKMTDFDTFRKKLQRDAMYEAIYKDSEGREILVITPLSLYTFVNRLWKESKQESNDD